MLRVRIDGGQLTTEQLRVIAGISQRVRPRHRRPHRPPERAAALDRGRVDARDLAPARGGRPRHDRGVRRRAARRPRVARRGHLRRRAHRPDAADRRDHRAASSATRRCRTSRASSSRPSPATPSQDVVHEINDVAFVAVEHPELGIGYDLWVGGGLSTAPRLGERLGVFVAPERVAEAWHGVAQIFRDYGYRRLRNKARLKFLLAEWGTEKFRQVLQDEYLGYALPDGPALPKPAAPGRPRRHPPSEGRPLLRRRDAHRRPRLGPDPRPARRPHRGARIDAAAHDPAPEGRHPRHPRGPGRVARRRSRRARPAGATEPHPPRHDRVHGHRVLQARDRRDQGQRHRRGPRPRRAPRRGSTCRIRSRCTSTAAPTRARASRPPTSASRVSSSRSTASRCPATRCTSAAGSPRRTATRPASAAPSAASRSPPTASPTTSTGSCAASSTTATPHRRDLRPVGAPRRRGGPAMTVASPRRPRDRRAPRAPPTSSTRPRRTGRR